VIEALRDWHVSAEADEQVADMNWQPRHNLERNDKDHRLGNAGLNLMANVIIRLKDLSSHSKWWDESSLKLIQFNWVAC